MRAHSPRMYISYVCVRINPQVAFIQLAHLVTSSLVTLEAWLTAPVLGTLCLHIFACSHTPFLTAHSSLQCGHCSQPPVLSPLSWLVFLWHVVLKSLPAVGTAALSPWVGPHALGPVPPLRDSSTGPGTQGAWAFVERIIRMVTFGLFICCRPPFSPTPTPSILPLFWWQIFFFGPWDFM